MSLRDDLFAADCIRFAEFSYRYTQTLWFEPLPRQTAPATFWTEKTPGALEMRLHMADVRSTVTADVRLEGEVVATESASQPLRVRWNAVDVAPGAFYVTDAGARGPVLSVSGGFTTEVKSELAPTIDADCFRRDEREREYRVLLTSTGAGDDVLEFGVQSVLGGFPGSAWAASIVIRAFAGAPVPAPSPLPPRPQVQRVTIDARQPICQSSVDRSFSGLVELDSVVRPEYGASGVFPVYVDVEAEPPLQPDDPGVLLDALIRVPVGERRRRFNVLVRANWFGKATVSAWAAAGEPHRSADLRISQRVFPRFGCGEPELGYRPWRQFPECPACHFWLLNDRGDMAGTRNGVAFRFVADTGEMEFFGQPFGPKLSVHALNALGHVAGGMFDDPRQPKAFVYGREDQLPLITVGNAVFLALNDRGQAVGYSVRDGRESAIYWDQGAVYDISPAVRGRRSIAVGVSNTREITGIYWTNDEKPKAFVLSPGDTRARDLSRNTKESVALAVNSARQVVGFARRSDGARRAFAYDGKLGSQELPLPKGFAEGIATDINEDGVVVGTLYRSPKSASDEASGFVYTSDAGVREINDLVRTTRGRKNLHIARALRINNAGQILVVGIPNKVARYLVIEPAEA